MLEDLDAFCSERLTEDDVVSLSVAVGVGGELAYASAFGDADVANGVVATPETPYLIASATKPITATAVALLWQRGQLDLDAPVDTFLDGVGVPRPDPTWPTPTVRQVLSHVGGFGTHYDFFYADRPHPRPSLEDTVARYATLFRPAGTAFEYSNLGYGLLDVVIAEVTGQDPADFVRSEVFEPVGATSGWVGPDYPLAVDPAVRYPADRGAAYPVYDTTHRGASMAWLTATDLARFALSHARDVPGVLLESTETLAHTAAATVYGDRDGDGYGFGWGIRHIGGQPVLSHGGAMGGVATIVTVAPEIGLCVAAQINQTDAGATARAVRDHVFAELLPGYEPPGDAELNPVPTPPMETGRWRGHIQTYEGPVPLALTVGETEVSAAVGAGEYAAAAVKPHKKGDVYPVRLRVDAQLPTSDAAVQSPGLLLALDRHDTGYRGAARAIKTDESDFRVGNCLSHWCELVPD